MMVDQDLPTDLYKENFNRIFNPTLTDNMPNVKWDQLPPRKGPDSNGIQTSFKQVVTSKKVSKKNIVELFATLNHYQGLDSSSDSFTSSFGVTSFILS